MTESAVDISGVEKRFGDLVAVRDLDLRIERGEFFSIIGPSGCGKTTTLRMIAGFEEPTAGRISVGGRDMTGVRPYRRPVNTVFQSYALFPHLDVFENVAFGLREAKVGKAEIRTRVGEAVSLVQLEGRERSRPRQLSGGQQQRVALARALVNRPEVLLLDEPLGALDLKLRTDMQTQLKDLQRSVGVTFCYVTHDQGEAFSMSDRVAVMNHGVLEQVGTPEELYERPANRFVAGFIGSPAMSFLEPSAAVALGLREAVVGVRPEHARRWREGLVGPLTGTVAFVEALGRETFLGVGVDGSRLVVFEEGRASADVGSEISFGLVREGLRYFDADGRAIT